MPLEVHAHDLVPVVLAEADEHAIAEDAGVVDDDVHVAEGPDRGIDDALGGIHPGDVVRVGDRLATALADLARHGHRGLVADVVDDDIRALGSEGERVDAPEAAAGSGDDYGASVTNTH